MIKIEKREDGRYYATSIVEFDFGKLGQDTYDENGNIKTTSVGMVVPNMLRFYEQLLLEKTPEDCKLEEFKEMLESYVQIRIADMCGLHEQPLKYDNGQVIGLKEGVSYEIQKENTEIDYTEKQYNDFIGFMDKMLDEYDSDIISSIKDDMKEWERQEGLNHETIVAMYERAEKEAEEEILKSDYIAKEEEK